MWEVLDEPETYWEGTQVNSSGRKSDCQHPHSRVQRPFSSRTAWPLLSPTSGETLLYLELELPLAGVCPAEARLSWPCWAEEIS